MQRFLSVLLALLLTACATHSSQMAHVDVHTDEFTNQMIFDNAISAAAPYTLDQTRMLYTWQLRTNLNKKTHETVYALLVNFQYYVDLKYFGYAADDNANPLQVINVYRGGGHCGNAHCRRTEKISIILNSEELKKHAQTGYRIKVVAKTGEDFILPISPDVIRTQLDAVEQYLHTTH